MIRKVAHLCLVTDQLNPMIDFYTQKLGFNLKFLFRNADGNVFGCYLEIGENSFVEIFDRVLKHKQWGGNSELQPLAKGNMIDHFCFEVVGMKEHIATLEARGVKIRNVKTAMDHSHQAWTSDPDGNSIEFMEYTAHSWQFTGNGDTKR
jgi:catechol 2,3-dioxygenase-like lactoylglutathione lyase family enzyme